MSLYPDVRPEGGLPFCGPPHPGVQTDPEADRGAGPLALPAGGEEVIPYLKPATHIKIIKHVQYSRLSAENVVVSNRLV